MDNGAAKSFVFPSYPESFAPPSRIPQVLRRPGLPGKLTIICDQAPTTDAYLVPQMQYPLISRLSLSTAVAGLRLILAPLRCPFGAALLACSHNARSHCCAENQKIPSTNAAANDRHASPICDRRIA